MAHIQKIKLKKGVAYQVHYRENGKKKTQYFPVNTPYKTVQTWARQFELDKNAEKLYNLIPELKPGMTIGELKNLYLEKRRTEIRIERHELTFKRLNKFFDFDLPLKMVTSERLTDFRDFMLDELLESKYDPEDFYQYETARRGVNREMANVRTIIRWAYKRQYLANNPFDRFDFFKNVTPHKITLMTREEERIFYKNLFTRHAKISYIIIRYTGMRRAEVRNLKYKDLDYEKGIVKISKQKNRKSNAVLPMHPALKRLLKWHQVQGMPDEKIFKYAPDYLSRYFREALDRAKLHHIKSPVHVHRHAFVTNVLKSTGDIALANELARHSNYNTTKRYLHLLPENLKKRFNKVKFK